MRFPEDDERNLEGELAQTEEAMDMMARGWPEMAHRRKELRKAIAKQQLDAKDAKLVELAREAGYNQAKREDLQERTRFLERRIDVRDKELDRTSDRDALLARAETAEATIERSKKRKRSR